MNSKDLRAFRKNQELFLLDEKRRKMQTSEASKVSRKPDAIRVKSNAPKMGSEPSGQFQEAEIDLEQIGQAYFGDAYISRAVNKSVGLMFKSGWGFSSLNDDALEYIETRFRLMEESTEKTTEELLRELGHNYVLYSNAPIAKTRGKENLAKLKVQGYYGGEPISGLFPINPEAFQLMLDEFGNVEKYTVGEGANSIEFSKEDFLNMTFHRPSGRGYGIPYITNTIRDVQVLRQIEEIVSKILFRNLHPLQTITVGLDKPGFEATNEEIEQAREDIANISLDEMIVFSERHKIETITSNSDFLDAYNYLKYFRQRVFTGLGMSESTMGVGDTANRSTSDNQSSDLVDLVKDFQQNFASEFQKIVNEMLFEGGYDPTLEPNDRVQFYFTEIEQAAKIARENHEIQKFTQNIQSLSQTRNNIGYQQEADLSGFYFNLVKGNQNIEADGTTTDGAVDNKDQPENQHGKNDSPSKDSMKDAFSLKKSDLIENSMLTDRGVMVTLFPDDAKGSEQSKLLGESWDRILSKLLKEESKSKEEIVRVFENYLSDALFESDKEKRTFASIISQNVCNLNKEQNLQADSFFLFKENLVGSYEAFVTLYRKGGTE